MRRNRLDDTIALYQRHIDRLVEAVMLPWASTLHESGFVQKVMESEAYTVATMHDTLLFSLAGKRQTSRLGCLSGQPAGPALSPRCAWRSARPSPNSASWRNAICPPAAWQNISAPRRNQGGADMLASHGRYPAHHLNTGRISSGRTVSGSPSRWRSTSSIFPLASRAGSTSTSRRCRRVTVALEKLAHQLARLRHAICLAERRNTTFDGLLQR